MTAHSRILLVAQVAAVSGILLVAGCADRRGGGEGQTEAKAALPTIDLSEGPAFPLDAHLESRDIASGALDFPEVFDAGEKLFHTSFNGFDGVGSFVLPTGAEIPRFGESVTSQSCIGCHNLPFAAAAGRQEAGAGNDPDMDGKQPFNPRTVTSLFGDGIVQRLAEEITEDLHSIRDDAATAAKANPGTRVERALTSKGIDYGALRATADETGTVRFDLSAVEGVDPDLVVRPIGWKGNFPTIRTLIAVGGALVMGMQSEEFVWKNPEAESNPDLDRDGVVRELSVGDVTALVAYNAGQETPQSLQRLADLGLVAAPDADTLARIEKGRAAFDEVGCGSCHIPQLRLEDTEFREPSDRGNGNYYDQVLAAKDASYDPQRPLRFDLLKDTEAPRAEAHPQGGAIIRTYGDFKRHHMGRHLADPGGPTPVLTTTGDELKHGGEVVAVPATVFLTAELWGVGNTGGWMHDGRAGSLEEAILVHGEDHPPPVGDPGRSEAQEVRDAFAALPAERRAHLVTFLRSLRTFSLEEVQLAALPPTP